VRQYVLGEASTERPATAEEIQRMKRLVREAMAGGAIGFAIFDPQKVKSCEPEWAEDYPAKTKRLIQRAVGVHYTVVNGRVICEDGRLTGELPGHILRTPAYRPRRAAASR
jgi:N-acyl-D-aspartate/D-glutamate deacylase